MARSESQLTRLLALIPYLQSHPGISVARAAETFGITPSTLLKDLEILYYCGLPGQGGGDLIEVDLELAADEGIINLTNADYMSRPLTISPDEAFGLTLALEYIAILGDTSLTKAASSALAKLRAALGEQSVGVGAVAVASASQAVRDAVESALVGRSRLELVYEGQRRYSTPVVEPVAVVVRRGIAYLQAWSLDADGWRTFRMERIADAVPTGEPSSDRGTPPPVPEDWNATLPFRGEVTVQVTQDGRWVSEYYPVRSVEHHDDGTCSVRLGIVDDTWLQALLLRLGPAVVSVDPPSAAQPARDAALEAVAMYDDVELKLT